MRSPSEHNQAQSFSTKPSIGALILAAGNSSRLGGVNKQLLRIQNVTLMQRAVLKLWAAGIFQIAIVSGFDAERIAAEVARLPRPPAGASQPTLVQNDQWQAGMGTSIRAGLTNDTVGQWQADGLLIVLPDQLLVTSDHFVALVNAFHLNADNVIATAYSDDFGAPALFGRAHFHALAEIAPAGGAKKYLDHVKNRVSTIRFEDAGIDVDTPADLERLAALGLTAPLIPKDDGSIGSALQS